MNTVSERAITSQEAYAAMYGFLERFNATYKSDDVAILLSGLAIASDGKSMDEAYLQEWSECLEKAKCGEIDVRARFVE